MRYAYHDAAFSSHYDSTIFNFQTARLGQYNPTTNCSLFFWTSVFHFLEYAVYLWYSSWTWWSSPNWWLHLLWNIFKDYSSSDQTIYRHNRHFLLYVALGWLLRSSALSEFSSKIYSIHRTKNVFWSFFSVWLGKYVRYVNLIHHSNLSFLLFFQKILG